MQCEAEANDGERCTFYGAHTVAVGGILYRCCGNHNDAATFTPHRTLASKRLFAKKLRAYVRMWKRWDEESGGRDPVVKVAIQHLQSVADMLGIET